MRSRMMGAFSSQSVSPVMTSLRPATAMMSPVRAILTSSRLFACIISRRPMRSFLPLFAHSAYVPASITPLPGGGTDKPSQALGEGLYVPRQVHVCDPSYSPYAINGAGGSREGLVYTQQGCACLATCNYTIDGGWWVHGWQDPCLG